MNRAFRFCWVIVTLVGILSSLGAHNADTGDHDALTHAASVVPDNEKYIHIGGGFFSRFDNCAGTVNLDNDDRAGSIRFHLEHMTWESPFVYLPRGELQLFLHDGTSFAVEMCRLDYVSDPATGRLLYRLSAECDQIGIVLIGDSVSPEDKGRPVLEGQLIVSDNGRVSITSFRIKGRNEVEAERHLNRVVYVKSDFSGLR